ncbi:DNA-binding protein [Colletotrichum truncatum]|uniref:DNA-binding protein n=1 Tax=Colletotrichum truncatum TaxID=5467 RepID=A0ACC3Z5I2_COLTU|nr:DNA-binding protein [Colletotrichum truncatum]KAF6795228.1 DNA-binding protein [Colletotrichum truncatum]
MLMPSALSCDTSQPPLTRLQAAMFASPPASPPSLSNQGGFGNIFDTCRSLQALLSMPQNHQNHQNHNATQQLPSPPPHRQLPTPPLAHAPPPLKLRLRPRTKPASDANLNNDHLPRKRIAKRAPPRGVNKRRRAADDDMGRDDALLTDEDVDSDLEVSSQQEQQQLPSAPSTPKRARIAPEALPLGLERSDYHTLHLLNGGALPQNLNSNYAAEDAQGSNVEIEADGEPWSAEDDRILVELVLEKLKLSKSEWQDCARSLGKDRNCLSRRWKSLMLQGEVGLKGRRTSQRTKLHGTWR